MIHAEQARNTTNNITKDHQESIMEYIMHEIDYQAKRGLDKASFREFICGVGEQCYRKYIYWSNLNKTNRKHIISILTNVGYEVEGLHSKKLRVYW